MIRHALLALVAVIGLTRSAVADEAADRLAAAKSLQETMQIAAMLPKLLDSMSGPIYGALGKMNPGRSDEIAKLVQEEMRVEMDRLRPEMLDAMAHIYAQNFTVDELRQLDAFYRSPIGKRTLELQPQISGQSMAVGLQIGQRALQEAMPRIEKKMRDHGMKTQKDA